MIEPSDLNAAATPAAALDEPTRGHADFRRDRGLRTRVGALQARLAADVAALSAAQGAFLLEVRDARRRLDLDANDPALPAILAGAELARRALQAALIRASLAYAEPSALRPFTVEEAIANPDALDESLSALVARLTREVERAVVGSRRHRCRRSAAARGRARGSPAAC